MADFYQHLAIANDLLDNRERDQAERALKAAQPLAVTPAEQALVLIGLADVAFYRDKNDQQALDFLEQSLALSQPRLDLRSDDRHAALAVAKACRDKSMYLLMMHRPAEAMAPLDAMLDRLLDQAGANEPDDDIERSLCRTIVDGMLLKGDELKHERGEEGRREAVACYRDLIRRFRDVKDLEVMQDVARAMHRCGWELGWLGRSDEEIAAYDDVIASYGHMNDARLRDIVLQALDGKLLAFRDQEDFEAALETCDALLARYESDSKESTMDVVARTLIRKGGLLNHLGKIGPELACYDKVIATCADHPSAELRKHAAEGLLSKAVALSEADQAAAEMECYDELLRRYAEDESAWVRVVAAHGLVHMGLSLRAIAEDAAEDTGVLETDAEIACYDRVIARYGDEESEGMARAVAQAQQHKGESLLETGRMAEAAACFDAIVDTYAQMRDPVLAEIVQDARDLRAEC
jgi:tetratricopeptide (TPR) repeat protein